MRGPFGASLSCFNNFRPSFSQAWRAIKISPDHTIQKIYLRGVIKGMISKQRGHNWKNVLEENWLEVDLIWFVRFVSRFRTYSLHPNLKDV